MADGGFASQYLPAFSHLLGEAESTTNTQPMMAPQFGGSPEQLMGIFQHPQTQALMQQLGIHFDPGTLRQSPFLPNQFMQAHPHLGGMLNQAMANVAATPEAPLVSGAGSGMSRTMQGLSGGPEMLRQYQVRQMLAPFQAAGATIPGQEFQRKQHLLDLLTKMEQDRQAAEARRESFKEQDQSVIRGGPKFNPATGEAWIPYAAQPAMPAGGKEGLDLQQAGAARPVTSLTPGMEGQQMMSPGYGLTPAQEYQPAGYRKEAPDPSLIKQMHPERGAKAKLDEVQANLKQAYIDAGYADAQADALAAKAVKDRAQAAAAGRPGGGKDYSKDYASVGEKYQIQIQALERMVAAGQDEKGNKFTNDQIAVLKSQIDQLNQSWQDEIDTIDKQRGDPGASRRERERTGKTFPKPLVPAISPGASPGGAQAGGAGSQTSEGTAVSPGATGLPSGYVFNEQGIPVPAQAPKQ